MAEMLYRCRQSLCIEHVAKSRLNEIPEEPSEGEIPHWTCLLRLLSCISGFMKATTKPGDRYESWVPLYSRGSSRGKGTDSTRSDRSVAHPSAAPSQAGVAVGGAHRSDEA